MSTLNVNTIQKINGDKHNQIQFPSGGYNQIGSSITWHTSYNGTTQTLGSISGATGSNVKAISLSVWYMHNGAANHGYLAGWYHQTGKTYNVDGVYNQQAHYNWYFNYMDSYLILPWDPNGTQSLSLYVSSAYNSSTSNEYRIYYLNAITQE